MREREQLWRSYFLSLGFTATIGAHSISEEVMGFSPLWYLQGSYGVFSFMVSPLWGFLLYFLCLLSLVFIVVHFILLDKILRPYCLNDKNLTGSSKISVIQSLK